MWNPHYQMLEGCLRKKQNKKSLAISIRLTLDGIPITKDTPGYFSCRKCFIQEVIKNVSQVHVNNE